MRTIEDILFGLDLPLVLIALAWFVWSLARFKGRDRMKALTWCVSLSVGVLFCVQVAKLEVNAWHAAQPTRVDRHKPESP